MKRAIKLTEGDLRRIVRESVIRILNEAQDDDITKNDEGTKKNNKSGKNRKPLRIHPWLEPSDPELWQD